MSEFARELRGEEQQQSRIKYQYWSDGTQSWLYLVCLRSSTYPRLWSRLCLRPGKATLLKTTRAPRSASETDTGFADLGNLNTPRHLVLSLLPHALLLTLMKHSGDAQIFEVLANKITIWLIEQTGLAQSESQVQFKTLISPVRNWSEVLWIWGINRQSFEKME